MIKVKKAPAALVLIFLSFGCGKKIENSKNRNSITPSIDPVMSDEESFLAKQRAVCEDKSSCPNYLVKIVSFHKKKPQICTGFLVNSHTVATSSSCLPDILRMKNQDCSADVTFFFPETLAGAAERVGCLNVVYSSDPQGDDPATWRDDVAFLKLSKNMLSRRSLEFSRIGFEDRKDFFSWAVDQVDDGVGFIRRQTCKAIHHSFVNPNASTVSSPNMLLADCSFKNGSSGAPVMDEAGGVRGLLSQSISSKFKTYIESTGLLAAPLRPMLHASNFSCAPTIFDSNVADETECSKSLDQVKLDQLREVMISDTQLFEGRMKQIRDRLESSNKFIRFRVSLVQEENEKVFEIQPNCFKNISNWILSINPYRGNYGFNLNLPQVRMKRTLTAYGDFGAIDTVNENQSVYVQFSVKQLKKNASSDVEIWNEINSERYQNLSENCH